MSKTTIVVERRVTAIVDQCLEFTVPSDVWLAALAAHDGNAEEAFDALNFDGVPELGLSEELVGEVLDVHEETIKEQNNA